MLEPLAQARGDFDELTRLYEKRLELHDDRAERAHWLRKIAEVAADQIGSPERAIAALGRALVEEPMPGAALDDIERIAGASKLPAAGAAKIEAVLDSADAEAGRELALRAARLYAEGGDRAAAERLYRPRARRRRRERRRADGAGRPVSLRGRRDAAWRRSSSGARRPIWIRRRGGRG